MKLKSFIFTLCLSFAIVLVMMNKSVNSYIEQKYHIHLLDSPILDALAAPSIYLDNLRTFLFPAKEDLAQDLALQDSTTKEEEIPEVIQIQYPHINELHQIELLPKSSFIFIGDSLMQGVGMTLGAELKKRGFKVIDIAKQSTGLTYSSFFDWEKTLEEAFVKNPNIDIVVMMVGANDPYSMPHIKYASPKWLEIYEARIENIINTAKENNAIIVWYELPIVKKQALNDKLMFLNSLYEKHIIESNQIFLRSKDTLNPDGIYTPYIKNAQGKSIKVRAEDGIHFSPEGSRVLGSLLLERLVEIKLDSTEEEEQASPNTPNAPNTTNSPSSPNTSSTPNTQASDKPQIKPQIPATSSAESKDSPTPKAQDSTPKLESNSQDFIDSHFLESHAKDSSAQDSHVKDSNAKDSTHKAESKSQHLDSATPHISPKSQQESTKPNNHQSAHEKNEQDIAPSALDPLLDEAPFILPKSILDSSAHTSQTPQNPQTPQSLNQ